MWIQTNGWFLFKHIKEEEFSVTQITSGGEGKPPRPFFENSKKLPRFWKK